MKTTFKLVMLLVVLSQPYTVKGTDLDLNYVPKGGARLAFEVNGNDTTYITWLRDLWVFPKKTFKNKQQEKHYWRTVRDVKKALPFAKLVGSELLRVNMQLAIMKNEGQRKKFLAQYEKAVFKKYEADLKKMTINQGRLLLKLIDRECDQNSYSLIKQYRGSVSAFFWQGVAYIFGSNLKSEYDAKGTDQTLERIIVLVESGQL